MMSGVLFAFMIASVHGQRDWVELLGLDRITLVHNPDPNIECTEGLVDAMGFFGFTVDQDQPFSLDYYEEAIARQWLPCADR